MAAQSSATPATVNVARFLPAAAARQPDALALRVPRRRKDGTGTKRGAASEPAAAGEIPYLDLTFAELDRETDAWAHRLSGAGIVRGSRVLLLVKPGLSLIALSFALFKTGAVPIVIDPGMGLRGFLRCVRRSEPEALVSIRRGVWLSRVFRRAFASMRTRVVVSADAPLTLSTGGEQKTPAAALVTAPFPVAPTRADELAAILFTSGSTGPAKGVCYEHGMFEAQVRAIRETYAVEPGEVDLPMLPIFALFNPALGMTTVVPEMNPSRPATVDPAKIVQAIRQCGVTNSFGSPVLWRKIGDHCLRHGIELPSLRRILSAGAPVPPRLMADFRRIMPNGTMHSPYGATEALPVTTVSDREILEFAAALTNQGRGTCVGRPVAGVEVRIIAIDDDVLETMNDARELPRGEIGEIIVRGPAITKSYDRLPERTALAKILSSEPGASDSRDRIVWHRMGDTGYFDDAGRLWFCGRKAERVVGERSVFFTECCEPVFNQHPRVARTALIGVSVVGRKEPVIVVEPKPEHWTRSILDRAVMAQELRELGSACATTREIKHFFFHRAFPVDVRHNAKIHRLALAKYFARRRPLRTR